MSTQPHNLVISLQRFLFTFQILPALLPLRLRRPDHAGRSDPGQFYWLSYLRLLSLVTGFEELVFTI